MHTAFNRLYDVTAKRGEKKENHPVLGGKKVYSYFENSVFSNTAPTEYSIFGCWENETYINLPKKGDCKLVVAAYDSDRLKGVCVIDLAEQCDEVQVPVGITLGKGDKIMLWDSYMKPMCDAYSVQ